MSILIARYRLIGKTSILQKDDEQQIPTNLYAENAAKVTWGTFP